MGAPPCRSHPGKRPGATATRKPRGSTSYPRILAAIDNRIQRLLKDLQLIRSSTQSCDHALCASAIRSIRTGSKNFRANPHSCLPPAARHDHILLNGLRVPPHFIPLISLRTDRTTDSDSGNQRGIQQMGNGNCFRRRQRIDDNPLALRRDAHQSKRLHGL